MSAKHRRDEVGPRPEWQLQAGTRGSAQEDAEPPSEGSASRSRCKHHPISDDRPSSRLVRMLAPVAGVLYLARQVGVIVKELLGP